MYELDAWQGWEIAAPTRQQSVIFDVTDDAVILAQILDVELRWTREVVSLRVQP